MKHNKTPYLYHFKKDHNKNGGFKKDKKIMPTPGHLSHHHQALGSWFSLIGRPGRAMGMVMAVAEKLLMAGFAFCNLTSFASISSITSIELPFP
jgi:hypothetical protein